MYYVTLTLNCVATEKSQCVKCTKVVGNVGTSGTSYYRISLHWCITKQYDIYTTCIGRYVVR